MARGQIRQKLRENDQIDTQDRVTVRSVTVQAAKEGISTKEDRSFPRVAAARLPPAFGRTPFVQGLSSRARQMMDDNLHYCMYPTRKMPRRRRR